MFYIATDASVVAGKENFGIGVVVLNEDMHILKILSVPLRSIGDLKAGNSATHEYYAALTGLKCVPKSSSVCLLVDNQSVKKAISGKFNPKSGAKYYRDFEIVLDALQERIGMHRSVDARYIHSFSGDEAIQCAAAIAHNASALVTGARKRQKTWPLLETGPFSSQSNSQTKGRGARLLNPSSRWRCAIPGQ